MKNLFIRTSLLTLVISSVLAFKVGEHVELIDYLNARSSAHFLSRSGNIKTQLPAGTKGVVQDSKKMPSGNFGIQLKIENGPRKGESYWIYYNVSAPKIKLFDKEKKEKSIDEISEVTNALLTEKQIAIKAPHDKAVIEAVSTATQVLGNKAASQVVTVPTGADCPPVTTAPVSSLTQNVSEENYTESDVVEPFREVATSPLTSHSCRMADGGWDRCVVSGTNKVEAFKLSNKGPNQIVKTNEYYISRDMSFEFDDRARSDMKLVVSDSPDDTTSHATYSVMLFFPRSVLPAIKKVGDELVVTLPTKEIVRYNAKTKEVVGGVFTEGAMVADPKNRNKAVAPNLKYTGNGVLIRSDKSGDLPYGDIELSNGSKAPSTSTATVSKKGFKDCKIPSKDIWYTDYNKGGSVFIKPEFASDSGMDSFIKKKCGFSLF